MVNYVDFVRRTEFWCRYSNAKFSINIFALNRIGRKFGNTRFRSVMFFDDTESIEVGDGKKIQRVVQFH